MIDGKGMLISDAQPPAVIVTRAYADVVDFYWGASVVLSNIREDIDGSDGRREYLFALSILLISTLNHLDELLAGRVHTSPGEHRVARALEHGIGFLGLSGEVLARTLLGRDFAETPSEIRERLLAFIDDVQARLPGAMPDSLGPLAQRQLLQVMRDWSKGAAESNEDLGFLAARFADL